MDTTCSSSSAESGMIEELIKRGWCFGDIDKVKALIVIQSALHGEASPPPLDLIESQLCNMDLKSIAAKSLPDSSVLRSKSARLQGPKVLQASPSLSIYILYIFLISYFILLSFYRLILIAGFLIILFNFYWWFV